MNYKYIETFYVQLLPQLQDVADKSTGEDNPVGKRLKELSDDLKKVLDNQMKVCILNVNVIRNNILLFFGRFVDISYVNVLRDYYLFICLENVYIFAVI